MKPSLEQLQMELAGVRLLIKSLEEQITALEVQQNEVRDARWKCKIKEAELITQVDLRRPKLSTEKILHLKPGKTL
jgi:prefoldin subunit 5